MDGWKNRTVNALYGARGNSLFDQPMKQGGGLFDMTTADVLNTPIARGNVLPLTEYANRAEFDTDSGLFGAMKRAFTAPGRAYTGKIPESRMIEEGANFAGIVGLGGYMSPKPASAIGAFGARVPRNGFELDYFGTPVQVVHNPSPTQINSLLAKTKYKAARRIVDPATGDTYIWDAADPALHQMVAEKLGIKFDPERADMIGLD